MSFRILVQFPNEDNLKFDMDYYVNTHMKMAVRDPKLIKWETVKHSPGPDGSKPFVYTTILDYADEASFHEFMASPQGREVFEDGPNFSNHRPTYFLLGTVIQGSEI